MLTCSDEVVKEGFRADKTRCRVSHIVGHFSRHWLTLACGTIGCANIIGVSEYDVVPSVSTPYLSTMECNVCLDQFCSAAQAACAADTGCSRRIADIRQRPDPNSAYERDLADSDANEALDHGESIPDPVGDLTKCVENSCLDVCATGQDFSCVGKFDWRQAPAGTVRLFAAPLGQRDTTKPWTFQACSTRDPVCSSFALSTATTFDGFASVTLDRKTASASEAIASVRYSHEDVFDWSWWSSRPLADGYYFGTLLPTRSNVEGIVTSYHIGDDSLTAYGLLSVVPFDCAGMHAKGVALDVLVAAGEGQHECGPSECQPAYETDKADIVPGPGEYRSAASVGFVARVPPGVVYLRLRNTRTDHRIVSVTKVTVTAGQGHFVHAYPASRTELEELLPR